MARRIDHKDWLVVGGYLEEPLQVGETPWRKNGFCDLGRTDVDHPEIEKCAFRILPRHRIVVFPGRAGEGLVNFCVGDKPSRRDTRLHQFLPCPLAADRLARRGLHPPADTRKFLPGNVECRTDY